MAGRQTGAETAEFIAGYGVPAVIVEMQDAIGADCEPGPGHFLMKRLGELGVTMYTQTTAERVEGVRVTLKKDKPEIILEGIDPIVPAAGMGPSGALREHLAGTGIKVLPVGDAASVKNGFSNVQEGSLIAWEI